MGCVTRSLLLLALVCILAMLLLVGVGQGKRLSLASQALVSMPAPSPSARSSFSATSSIRGRPSLSASFINRVLAAYHSPAIGLGQAMVADSLRFGIDDAVALAIFQHESSFGTTGVARVTHSLGNLICTPGWPVCVAGFRWYASWAAGCLDWFRLMAVDYLPRGLSTLARIIPVASPASAGNDVAGYIAAVVTAVRTWRAGHVLVFS